MVGRGGGGLRVKEEGRGGERFGFESPIDISNKTNKLIFANKKK